MPYQYREIKQRLQKLGYSILRQGKGSHVIFGKENKRIIVPNHGGKDISIGVEKKIIKSINLSSSEFRNI